MTLLAPGWLAAGAAAALALVALHLLAIGRPAPFALPTARFVPLRAARARRLARRPTDVVLLAMRAAAVLLAATALARPTRTPTRRPVARVIVADRSVAERELAAVRDHVRALAGTGDLLVAFDSTTAPPVALGATPAARDSAIDASLGNTLGAASVAAGARGTGSLSAALAAARRAAPALRDGADSVELAIVSPLATGETDAATAALRRAWGGRVRLMRVVTAATESAAAPAPVAVRLVARHGGIPDDALAAAAAMLGSRSAGPARVRVVPLAGAPDSRVEVGGPPPSPYDPAAEGAGRPRRARVVRDGLTAADSTWARDSAGVLLDWPADGVPRGWMRRARIDTAGAVATIGTTRPDDADAFVAPMARRAAWTGGGARVIARWADGEPAAVERATGDGCVRAVAVPVPQVGDAALRPPFLALLGALAAPCAHRVASAPLDSAAMRALAGDGPLLATRALGTTPAPRDPLARWLLAAALALLVAELPARRLGRPRDAATAGDDETPAEAAA